MKAGTCLILLALLCGCLIEPPGTHQQSEATAVELPTTSSGAPTTTHKYVPVTPVGGLVSTTTTFTGTPVVRQTVTTSSTSTTMTLILKRRDYQTAGENTFYLTQAEPLSDGGWAYTLRYNTSDGKWDTITFINSTMIDGLIALLTMPDSGVLTPTMYLMEGGMARYGMPSGGRALMIGGGLGNRSFGGYSLSLDGVESDGVKIRVAKDADTLLMDVPFGAVAYYGSLEVGLLDPHVGGGRALIYALLDSAEYERNGGARFCPRDYVVYPDAETMVINEGVNATYRGMLLGVGSPSDAGVRIKVYSGGMESDFLMSCGSRLTLPGGELNMLWWGRGRGTTAKFVAHS
jgi:hypothetical protein